MRLIVSKIYSNDGNTDNTFVDLNRNAHLQKNRVVLTTTNFLLPDDVNDAANAGPAIEASLTKRTYMYICVLE